MNAPLWTAAEAAKATGGDAGGRDWSAGGVSIDTRELTPGDLFVALTDQRDGHDFVAQALDRGAAAALVSRRPEGVADDAPLLLVDDVLSGLQRLGIAGRARSAARVVGITGSVGKTSTKEMLRAVLGGQGRVHTAERSFNNHWGVPLTLARLPQDADYAVIEIGMNHPGEIAPLARMADLHLAIITTVAAAHLEAFESVEGIAREKAAIFDGLRRGGTAIVNADIPTHAILYEAARAAGARLMSFGTSEGADYRLTEIRLGPDHTVCRLGFPDSETVLFKFSASGRHFAMNGSAVLAAADALGCDRGIATGDLGRWLPPAGRGTREKLRLDPVESDLVLELIDDAFNANPASMEAALEVLGAARPIDALGRIGPGRRIAILGDMLELGPQEAALHAALADHPAMAGLDIVHCVGPRMRALYDALPPSRRGRWVETADDLGADVRHLLDAGDVVLVKGSKGSCVSRVVDAIRNLGQAEPDQA